MNVSHFIPQTPSDDDIVWNTAHDRITVKIKVTASDSNAAYRMSGCTLTIAPFSDDLPDMVISQHAPVTMRHGEATLFFFIEEDAVGIQNMRWLNRTSARLTLMGCSLSLSSNLLESSTETWLYVRNSSSGCLRWVRQTSELPQRNQTELRS